MISTYKMLFQVKCFHAYFYDGICKGITYIPGEETKQLMDRFNLLIKPQNDGFKFYTTSKSSTTDFLKYITQISGNLFFDFNMSTTYDDFFIFTDFPLDWTGYIHYNSQSELNEKEGVLKLNPKLSSKRESSKLANLKLYFNTILSLQSSNKQAVFQMEFKPRATQWQYYIINKNSILMDNPEITSTSNICFEPPKQVTIQNGEQAILFSSGDRLIELSEVSKYKFELINTDHSKNTKQKIFTGLPNPDSGSIGIVNINGKKHLSSPMYVYV